MSRGSVMTRGSVVSRGSYMDNNANDSSKRNQRSNFGQRNSERVYLNKRALNNPNYYFKGTNIIRSAKEWNYYWCCRTKKARTIQREVPVPIRNFIECGIKREQLKDTMIARYFNITWVIKTMILCISVVTLYQLPGLMMSLIVIMQATYLAVFCICLVKYRFIQGVLITIHHLIFESILTLFVAFIGLLMIMEDYNTKFQKEMKDISDFLLALIFLIVANELWMILYFTILNIICMIKWVRGINSKVYPSEMDKMPYQNKKDIEDIECKSQKSDNSQNFEKMAKGDMIIEDSKRIIANANSEQNKDDIPIETNSMKSSNKDKKSDDGNSDFINEDDGKDEIKQSTEENDFNLL